MAKARIEYVRLRRGGDQGAMDASVIALNGGSAEVLTVGAVSVQAAAAPSFPDGAWNSGIHAKITCLSGAVIAEVGASPDADFAGGTLILAGREAFLPIEAGEKVALIEATVAMGQRASAVETAAVAGSTAPYAAGDVVGTKMTFANMADEAGGAGLLQTVSVLSKSAQTALLDLILFNADPVTTFVDNAPLALNTADADKLIGVVHLSDWTALGGPSIAQADGLAKVYKVATTGIIGVLVTRAAMTLLSAGDLTVVVKGLPD